MAQLKLFPDEVFSDDETILIRTRRMVVSAKLERAARADFHRDRGDSAVEILTVLFEATAPMTRRQICNAIGREKTPFFIRLLEEMVERGRVIRYESAGRNNVLTYLYEAVR